ncbi:serine/threonine-protein kinase D1-like [Sinocyclocheilus rhinocerous]|uniref:serine/threonine-protein kinase D1-like n=1 Tax=Sinocyclocheilus rhinocerous TaxID=307959 RepID=UPI0007B8D3F2|nr:PREDICTED: serine/threonine-protein kinase D1-like [Sinocyclocheilus rhinocerous]
METKYHPHSLVVHSYRTPTFCHYCGEMLWGLVRQGLKCEGCGLDFHKRCVFKLTSNCSRVYRHCGPSLSLFPPGRPRTQTLSSHTGGSLEEVTILTTYCKYNCHRRCMTLVPPECNGEKANGEEPDENMKVVTLNDLYEELRYKDPPAIDITPLQPSVTECAVFSEPDENMKVVTLNDLYEELRYKDPPAIDITPLQPSVTKRHYWVLNGKSITLYPNEISIKYYKEISLSEVLQVRGPAQLTIPVLPGNSAHSFELVTGSLVYCVFADQDGPSWESALDQALRPVQGTVCHTTNNTGDGKNGDETQDISELYQIFSDEVLGSGQFGVVYGGTHRHTGRPVAVKVIDKTRFPTKQEEQTKNEVSILQRLSHPGVIHIERTFKTMEHTFVVMEKLHSDMLEMILSHENGRLTERTTRFLVTQVLEALRYLHMRDVAHCDLKPENVLLASPEPFPQVKLCDFGFARIIGQKSFRRTVVGTPAYLAPEVICSKGYNRSLDVWAVGVILYVSLSGTFPFNEDEDINQQITNASFMYPHQPWSLISLEAVNLINNLLQVVVRRRFSVGKAMGHPWFQNFQMWCDLREFEQRMGYRYLTHEADDERWRSHALEKGLSFPQHLK